MKSALEIAYDFYKNEYPISYVTLRDSKHCELITEYIEEKEEELTDEFMEEWEVTLLRHIEALDSEDEDYIRACENGGY